MPAALPAEYRAAWDAIGEIEAGLRSALVQGEGGELDELANRRHESITRFFATLPLSPAFARLREELLGELVTRNESLLRTSRELMQSAAREVARARHNRHAIGS